MDASCQCGAVAFKTPMPKPLALYICHCAECRRQTSSAFGTSAIFPRFKLPDAELLSVYTRPTASGQTLYCYFCKQCGTRLIHTTPNKNVVSVKGGCLEGLDWTRAIHIWTKSAMIPIPEDAESYSEESTQTGGYSDYSDCQETLDQPPNHGAAYDKPGSLTGSGAAPGSGEAGSQGQRGQLSEGLCELSGPDLKSVLHGM